MLSMRCRVLQNELVEGQQEQQAATRKLVVLEHTLQQQKQGEQTALQRSSLLVCLIGLACCLGMQADKQVT